MARPRTYRRIALSVVAILALVFAGCDGSNVEDAPSSPADTLAAETSTATPRPDDPRFPDELPLPDGGYYGVELSLSSGTFVELEGQPRGPIYVFEWSMSVEELISVMDTLLAASGWTTSEHARHLAFPNDVVYRAVGHGREVGIEIGPSDGADDAAYIAVLLIG